MKNRIILSLTALFLLSFLCSCFPTKENNASTTKSGKITMEQLSSQITHIAETPFENFTVDADVHIDIKNNFNIFKANYRDYDIDQVAEVLLKDMKIVKKYSDGAGFFSRKTEDGLLLTCSKETTTTAVSLIAQEYFDRELEWYISDSSNNVRYDRDKILPKSELDFMKSDDAVNLADDMMKKLDVPVARYDVYSITHDYLIQEDNKILEEFGSEGFIQHGKEDEFYLVVPRLRLPNDSCMAETEFDVPDAGSKTLVSGKSFFVVNRNGLIQGQVRGSYSFTGESEAVNSIISVDEAYSVIKKKYSNMSIQDKILIDKIELSYAPYFSDEEGVFLFKPTWLFYFNQDNGSFIERSKKMVDATTGTEVRAI